MPQIAVKVRNALNDRHRARYLLSGLLVCGACGAGYTLRGADRYGCADHVNRGICTNRHTVSRAAIERRVLAGLKEKLLAPELVAEFVREFQAEYNRRAREAESSRAHVERELADVEARLRQIVDAIEQGILTASTRERLLELEARRDALKAKLTVGEPVRSLPRLHPGLAEIYRQKVERLEEALNRPEDRAEAHAALRAFSRDRAASEREARRGAWRAGGLMRLIDEEKAKTHTL